MTQHSKLKEVIFEITDQCGQNCSYCGSKNILNKTPIDEENIKAIVDNIALYPPEEINISGGNPLLLFDSVHEYLVSTLSNTKCKIIVNPFNIAKTDPSTIIQTLNRYSAIGVSVNNLEELKYCTEQLSKGNWNKIKSKITIITNFNMSNIWNFKDIESLVILYGFVWQVQYTMYMSAKDGLGVYTNTEADKHLRNLISESKAKVVMADNMNAGNCSAGMYSLGILANGDVVPCLSMRSWGNTNIDTFGNLLETDLKDIWINNFAAFRCGEFKCCKDVTGCLQKSNNNVKTLTITGINEIPVYQPPTKHESITLMYGVTDSTVFVYGVVGNWDKK